MKNRILSAVFASVAVALIAAVVYGMGGSPANYTWVKQSTQSQKIGFGSVVTPDAVGGLAISSCDGPCVVGATTACQIGTGSNGVAGSLQYRDKVIVDGDGGLGMFVYGQMRLKYVLFDEEWMEAGYVANAATTNVPGAAIPGSKFSESENRGSWYVTVVDGDSDNAEVIKINDDAENSELIMTPNNKAADSLNAQLNGEMFEFSENDAVMNVRFTLNGSNGVAWVGLNLANTTAAIDTPGTDYMGFFVTNSVGNDTLSVYFKYSKDSVAGSVLCGTMSPLQMVSMGFGTRHNSDVIMWPLRYDLDVLTVTYNGTVVGNMTAATAAYCDNEPLAPCMAIRSTTTDQTSLMVDYIGVAMTRQ